MNELFRKIGSPDAVTAGPFKGLKYRYWHPSWNGLNNMLGTYEHELAPVVERAIMLAPDVFINVGSAEGYFTLGMAMRLPSARVIAYDLKASARYMLGQNADLNGLRPRIDQREGCTPQLLQHALKDARCPMVVCDCEGYEEILLDSTSVPLLTQAIILVEVHDATGFAPGVADRLRDRFSATHRIEMVRERKLVPADRPAGLALDDREWLECVDGDRGLPGLWYFMVPAGLFD